MCPPPASPTNFMDVLDGSDKGICMSLQRIRGGDPLPSNVIKDVNPYQYRPSDLPYGIWYLIKSKMKKDADFGYWRSTKGGPCQIFANTSFICWRSTLEFFEGREPNGQKTNWVMREHWITRKILSTETYEKDIVLLCDVFLVGDKKTDHEKLKEIALLSTTQPTKIVAQNEVEKGLGKGSTSKLQVIKVNEARSNVTAGEIDRNNNADIAQEVDYLSDGNFLELEDLLIPASPSSSSDSSCVSMSSGECFDALDLLRDLEAGAKREAQQDNAGCNLLVFESSRPNQVVMDPQTTVTLDNSPNEEMPESRSMPSSAINKKLSYNESKNVTNNRRGDVRIEEAMASTSQNQATATVSEEDGKPAARGKKKKLKKYLCFMKF